MPNAVAWAVAKIADIKREKTERAELSDLLRGRNLKLINPIHVEPRLIPNKDIRISLKLYQQPPQHNLIVNQISACNNYNKSA